MTCRWKWKTVCQAAAPARVQEVHAVGAERVAGPRGDALRRARPRRPGRRDRSRSRSGTCSRGHDERVTARGRVDVHEGDRALVAVDDGRGQIAGGDLAEQAVRVGSGHDGQPIPRARALASGRGRHRPASGTDELEAAVRHLASFERRRPPRASAAPRSGSPRGCASWAPMRAWRPSAPTGPTGGRSGCCARWRPSPG